MTRVSSDVGLDLRKIAEAIDPVVYGRVHELRAPAKLNLRLKVLGRRADGYHLLSMLNVSSTLADTVSVSLTKELDCSIAYSSPETMANVATSDNSVTRAFIEFWREFGCEQAPLGFRVTLTKRIPVGAGLGGGSSDAGAMLRFLVQCASRSIREQIGLTEAQFDQRVIRAATRVGADVPYAYRGGVCWVTGIGEIIQPLSMQSVWPGEVLITVPPAPVPTVAFYQFFREQNPVLESRSDEQMEALSRAGSLQFSPKLLLNDFEREASHFVPEVGTALRCAREFFPNTSSLTGSGSAIFSLVDPSETSRLEPFCKAAALEGMVVHRVRLLGEAKD